MSISILAPRKMGAIEISARSEKRENRKEK